LPKSRVRLTLLKDAIKMISIKVILVYLVVVSAGGYILYLLDRKNWFCIWEQDNDGNWFTDCEEGFWLEEGTPKENNFKFCAYCGRMIKQVPYEEEKEEQNV